MNPLLRISFNQLHESSVFKWGVTYCGFESSVTLEQGKSESPSETEKNRGHLGTFHSSEGKLVRLLTAVCWWEGQPHNNKYIVILIVFCHHFSLSPSFCSPLSFFPLFSCPHYLSLLYSITPPPPVRMPSCLLILIFIYRFSSFSLPFLSTDGTLQLASHSASSLTSPRVNAFHVLLPFFCYNIRYFWAFQYREGRLPQRAFTTGEQVLVVLCYSKATKVTHFPYTLMKRSWYGSRKLSEKKRCH